MAQASSCILSAENLLHNVATLRAAAPRSKFMAMVKANAYGHGLRSVGRHLEAHVDALGVASCDEALALRRAGVKSPIVLIKGVFEGAEFGLAAEYGFHVVFHHPSQLQWLSENPPPSALIAWLKLDSGMGRLGFSPESAPHALQILTNSRSIQQPVGIMSHFARADEPRHVQNQQQITVFENFAAHHNGPKSFCNSAGIFAFPDRQYDWVRPGLALFGASPLLERTALDLGLKSVMTLRSRLISVKVLKRGETVGYGSRFACPEDMPIGILAIGYGDGYPRTVHDGTPVLLHNVRCPIVGRVSMDMAAIDLRPCPHAGAGDDVTLWGEGLPVEEVARTTDNINYDLLTGVQNRVKSLWTTSKPA
jgi:alanine racemase